MKRFNNLLKSHTAVNIPQITTLLSPLYQESEQSFMTSSERICGPRLYKEISEMNILCAPCARVTCSWDMTIHYLIRPSAQSRATHVGDRSTSTHRQISSACSSRHSSLSVSSCQPVRPSPQWDSPQHHPRNRHTFHQPRSRHTFHQLRSRHTFPVVWTWSEKVSQLCSTNC